MICTRHNCKDSTIAYILEVQQRVCKGEVHLCERHSEEYFNSYDFAKLGEGAPVFSEGAICFDLELVAFYQTVADRYVVYLRECGGTRILSFQTGYCEALAILHKLQYPGLPSSHVLMGDVIQGLRANVKDVLVHSVSGHPGQHIFHSQIRLWQDSRPLVIEARISDAVALALVCNVPMFVSEAVLARISGVSGRE
jgi:bifunctional DNase/RNase